MLDTVARQVGSDSTYWWFLIGSVNSVNGGVRRINLSYGGTNISGAFITTGVVQSQDGKTQLDLDAGTFKGRLQFLSADESTYKDLNTLDGQALTALSNANNAKAKTDLLKALAYEDLVEIAKLGNTVIVGGYIKTTLLDAAYIRSNIINADYIETLEINAIQGTIGGIEINAGGISAPKFSLTAAGSIIAVDATITGTIKTANSGQRAVLDSGDNTFKFYNSDGGLGLTINSAIYGSALSSGISIEGTGGGAIYHGEGFGLFGGTAFGRDSSTIKGVLSFEDSSLSTFSINIIKSGTTYYGQTRNFDFGSGNKLYFRNGILVNWDGF